jgi:hypothetical protein
LAAAAEAEALLVAEAFLAAEWLDMTGPALSTSLSKRELLPGEAAAEAGAGRVLALFNPPPEEPPSSNEICRL